MRPKGSRQPKAYCQFTFAPSVSLECAFSDEGDVDVSAPSYFVQYIDLSASLTSCDFKYDRRESYEPSGHSQGKIPPDLFGFALDYRNPARKGFLPSAV